MQRGSVRAGKLLDYQQPAKQGRFDWFECFVVCAVGGIAFYALFLMVILFVANPF